MDENGNILYVIDYGTLLSDMNKYFFYYNQFKSLKVVTEFITDTNVSAMNTTPSSTNVIGLIAVPIVINIAALHKTLDVIIQTTAVVRTLFGDDICSDR